MANIHWAWPIPLSISAGRFVSADRSYRRLIDGTILTRREYQQACTAIGGNPMRKGRQRKRQLAEFKELLRWKGTS